MTTKPAPHVLVLFGATGDLAARKLFPGLYRLALAKRLPDQLAIIGSGRRSPGSDEDFRSHVHQALKEFVGEVDEMVAGPLLERIRFVPSSADDGTALAAAVHDAEDQLALESGQTVGDVQRLLYLSVPPQAVEPMVAMLDREQLNVRSRLVAEKPFGTDLASARELDAVLSEAFDEKQIFRIDHFIGKEAVQNLLALRFANGLFEPAWNRHSIESVQIDVPEKLTVTGRGSFYEGTGCLRDMVTTHLCQLLGFVAMEDPHAFREGAIRAAKAAAFAAVRPLDPERVVFGQYDGYREEPDVDPDSDVETYVAIEAWIDNDRWRGVPFYLRTGKALAAGQRTITIRFIDPRHRWLQAADPGATEPNELVIELSDDPRIEIDVRAKRPGPGMALTDGVFRLHLGGDTPDSSPLEAYERLLLDVMNGDRTLFTSAGEVERLWEICQPVLEHRPAVESYPQGSWGPESALDLPLGGWRLGRNQKA
ncbi:glucose-6-phosphate 1-dehydrogenase [Nocardioides luteus]|uniref:Glucose-6-phosphate 1-dehydrogenase n=1 Tax=Nocardioides luteus TaxID=1844 RepID=A0ABQ5T1B9_9ACTN|nr:glucose-6-phosphate dehydrogenase [Nocardioides luteus]MDR7310300.1 glucose-6-phosphate 1-dehydrogenase [Nocardioides luteus]GGR53621.1 glucose-6-phosphate 1-dehydrogenase [Nocardioides luteus]GLJ69921.1 glucose-6-phosphate 1-dehydrogenase [Nocardioides luteus]